MSDIPDPGVLAGHLAQLIAVVDPLREATLGYRNNLIEKGLGKEAADSCAADFHHWLIESIIPQGKGKS